MLRRILFLSFLAMVLLVMVAGAWAAAPDPTIYMLKSLWQLKKAVLDKSGQHDYWQAGKSVAGIQAIEPVNVILERFAQAEAEQQ